MNRALLTLMAVALGMSAHFVGEEARAARTHGAYDEDLMYLPEGRILRMASLGHRAFAADIVWLTAIQYYGEQKLTGQTYDQAERLFQAIYDLDPHFKGAVRFGALVLAEDAGNPPGGLALLERAEHDHPGAWEYPFDRGFICHTVTKDYAAAGEAYRTAAELPGAPDLAIRLAGISFARLGDRDSAREVWNALLDDTQNELLARLAVRSLRNLDMEDAQDRLTDALKSFRAERGRPPADWTELVRAGFLDEVPPEPWGGAYLYDESTEHVWSTTHVDRRMAAQRDVFADACRDLRAARGHWPTRLEKVLEQSSLDVQPWRPFGLWLDYDPATGVVSWNPPWPATEPGNQGGGRT
jgi:tetratricopeptide (TPR) repeat protein